MRFKPRDPVAPTELLEPPGEEASAPPEGGLPQQGLELGTPESRVSDTPSLPSSSSPASPRHSRASSGPQERVRSPRPGRADRTGAGWVRGLKGCRRDDVSLPPPARPSAPSLQEEPGSAPHLQPPPPHPRDSAQAPYLGKDTKLEQSAGGARDILCVLWRWSGRGGAALSAGSRPGKAFYGQDNEGLPCCLDLGLLLQGSCPRRSPRQSGQRERSEAREPGNPGAYSRQTSPPLPGEPAFTEAVVHARHLANAPINMTIL